MSDPNYPIPVLSIPQTGTMTALRSIDESSGRVAPPLNSQNILIRPTINTQMRSSNVQVYNDNGNMPDLQSDPILPEVDEESKRCYSPFNLCLWISLPITIFLTIFQLIVAVLIDIFGAMFWSSSILILRLWTRRNQVWLKVLVIIFSPLLIIAGIFAMPCVLSRLPNYRFLNQTVSQWQRVKYYFPRQIQRCLKSMRCPKRCRCRR